MTRFLDALAHDFRYALTALRSAPGFVFVTLLSLALGIGANTALFSLLDAVMLKSLPVKEPERLVVLDDGNWTNPIWERIRDDTEVFEGTAAWGNASFDLGLGGETQYVRGVFTSGSYFEVVGVPAILGRTFTPLEDRRGCGEEVPPAVLSYGFWQRHYGGAAEALGQSLRLDGVLFTVVGVTPPRFFGLSVGEAFDVAVPICAEAAVRGTESALDQRSYWWLEIVGRLERESTLTSAEEALRASQPGIREATMPQYWPAEYQAEYLEDPFTLKSARSGVSRLRDRYGESLLVLMGISALVLLVACANIANLLLARATARSRELAVRLSVGATRSRLARQLLIESVDGYAGTDREDRVTYYNYVTPGYFQVLSTPLLAGRDLNERDTATSPLVAVVNETFAAKFFDGTPLGHRYRVRVEAEWWDVEIVGIVRDAKYRRLDEPIPPTAYAPYAQVERFRSVLSYVMKARGDLEGLRSRIVEQVGRVSPDAALRFRTLESQVDDSLVQERLLATLSAIFGVLALIVAAVGLAGLVAYGVSRRRAELGIRSALGATPRGLVLLVLRDVAFVTSVGLALGAAGALASGRVIASLLFGLSAGDLETLLLAAAVLALVAGIASLWPASRAARIDAMACLRAE